MDTPNARLKAARIAAGFETATLAAQAMGVPIATYTGHENGRRGFPAKRAPQYAKKFRTSESWLLYGKGDPVAVDPFPSADELTEMLQEVVNAEVTVETRIADLPSIFGKAMREQLEHYGSGGTLSEMELAANVRDKAARSRPATKPGEQEVSHTA